MYWVDLLGVVRRLHKTEGSSSTQAPAARLSGAKRRFLMRLHTRPFAFSTCPLDCGCATKPDALILAEVLELFGGEICSAVGDDAVWYAKAENDGPDKVGSQGSCFICDRDSFYPLCKLVDCHQEVSVSASSGFS